MGNLQNHVRWFSRAQWMLGVMMVACLGTFFLFGYRPQMARLHQLQAEIGRSQYELQDSQFRTRTLPIVASDVKRLRQQLDASRKLPSPQELPQFLKDITQLGAQFSLHPFTFKQGLPSHGELFSELPVTLSFEGDFMDAFNFLRCTEQMQRLIRVRDLNVKSKDAQSGRVEVQLSINIYFSPD
jgi:Tfp pilus assembly protein PilO